MNDRLVTDYLAAVAAASADLPAAQREALIADLREHIASARADLSEESDGDVRAILAGLGDPNRIAAEARLDATPAPAQPPAPVVRARSSRVWIAVLLGVVGAVALGCVGVAVAGLLFFSVQQQPGPTGGPMTDVTQSPPR